MTYHFEYTLDIQANAEPQEWEVFLTPEEEEDYREEGTDPAEAAEQIAIEEILDFEFDDEDAMDDEEASEHLSLKLTEVEADDDPDEEEENPDEDEDDPENAEDGWATKVTQKVTVNRVSQVNGEVTVTTTTRITRTSRTVRNSFSDDED